MAKLDPKQLKQIGASTGDILSWDGTEWNISDTEIMTGLTTSGLADGDVVYISAALTASKSDAAIEAAAAAVGVYKGTSGQLKVGGKVSSVKFTTDGGTPGNGAAVFVALDSDDTDTGAGKLTATAPDSVTQFVSEVGICLDNSNYAGSKTCVVAWALKPVVAL